MKFCTEILLQILHSVFLQVNYLIHASMRDFEVTSDRMQLLYIQKSRRNAVGIVTRLWAGRPRFQFLRVGGQELFTSPLRPGTIQDPSILLFSVYPCNKETEM